MTNAARIAGEAQPQMLEKGLKVRDDSERCKRSKQSMNNCTNHW